MFQNHGQLFRLILKYNLCLFTSSNIWHGLFTFAHDSNGKEELSVTDYIFVFPDLTLFWLGSFGTIVGALCPPLFLLYLWSNCNQTWRDGTLRQNLSEAIKILLMSSLWVWHHQAMFGIIQGQNSSSFIFCQWSWNLAQGSILKHWGEKCHFSFKKNWNFCTSVPWQKCYHGNTLGCC